ncbi:hypothetical protein AB0442_29470 [Kitasatospora sp. NPDC085895]|uniref:hypothetical protein n=1 Tax=Kitasatospora sp. NPDC085895 TaxID=3155057 RepID=UPI00344EAFE4
MFPASGGYEETTVMGPIFRTAAAASAAALLLAVAAPAASAAEDTHMHRGTDGCFSWSWRDDWNWKARVYYHNRCKDTRLLNVAWRSSAYKKTVIKVPGGAKGSTEQMSDPSSIWDGGRA